MFILYPTTKYFIYLNKDKLSYYSIGPGDIIKYRVDNESFDVIVLYIGKETVKISGSIQGEYKELEISRFNFEDMVYNGIPYDTEFKQDWMLYSVEQKVYYSIGDTFSIFSLTKGIGKKDVTFTKVIRGNIGTNVYLTYQVDREIVLNNPDYTGRININDIKGIPFYDDCIAISNALNKEEEICLYYTQNTQ